MAETTKKIPKGNWAIKPEALETLASSDFGNPRWKESGEVNQVNLVDRLPGGIAVLHIDGALSFRSDFFSAFFGLDTYDSVSAAYDELLADKSVKGIVLSIHSPGGEVSGVGDLSKKIFESRGSKPLGIVAHTAGMMCSAAYYIGSSAEKVFTSSIGEVGSIGVLCIYDEVSEGGMTVVRSDLSANKSPIPTDPAGLSLIKRTLNSLTTVFLSDVARNRGTDFQTVLSASGQGATFIGNEAVQAGLADGVMTLEEVIKEMINGKEGQMAQEKTNTAGAQAQSEEVKAQAHAAGIAEERARISGIRKAFEGLGMDDECGKCIDDGTSVADATAHALSLAKKAMADAKAENAAGQNTPAAEGKIPENVEALVRAWLKANASAANGIATGTGEQSFDAKRKAFFEGFDKVFKGKEAK